MVRAGTCCLLLVFIIAWEAVVRSDPFPWIKIGSISISNAPVLGLSTERGKAEGKHALEQRKWGWGCWGVEYPALKRHLRWRAEQPRETRNQTNLLPYQTACHQWNLRD